MNSRRSSITKSSIPALRSPMAAVWPPKPVPMMTTEKVVSGESMPVRSVKVTTPNITFTKPSTGMPA